LRKNENEETLLQAVVWMHIQNTMMSEKAMNYIQREPMHVKF
jgi:hypothetical protein